MPECPNCEVVFQGPTCLTCNWTAGAQPAAGAQTNEEKRQPRPEDPCGCGQPRHASGRCRDTGLWPRYVWRKERREKQAGSDVFTLKVPCPYACPVCAQPLEWHGGCYQCHGSATPWDRTTWTFPGDCYERTEDGHWEKVAGPRKACSPAENAAGFATVRAILAGKMTAPALGSRFPAVDPAVRAQVERPAVTYYTAQRLPDACPPVISGEFEWDLPDASYADLIETLTDLARAGHEAEFRELAAMRNVPAHQLDALWTGTVRRVRPQPPTTKGTP